MNGFMLYLITRLDSIHKLSWIVAVLGIGMFLVNQNKKNDRPVAVCMLICILLLVLVQLFVPTATEALAISACNQ